MLRCRTAPDPGSPPAQPSLGEPHAETPLTAEPSCKDEARIGQKNGIVRQWARRGSRPRQPADQRYESAYLFGAICPARGTGAALALPYADTEAMQFHLNEVSLVVAKGAHAVLLLDRAGWHTTGNLIIPKNITLVFLPSRAPELNPVENIWQYLRHNWLPYGPPMGPSCQSPISPPATCFRPWSARWPPLDVVRGTREPISQAQYVAATSCAASSHPPSRRRDLWEQAIGGLLDPLSPLSLSVVTSSLAAKSSGRARQAA